MAILVMKFGGTSVAAGESRQRALLHIERERALGYGIVVVVSAMGRQGDPYATDTLLGLAGDHTDALPPREKDMLAACGEVISANVFCALLAARGIPATVLTGGQAGITTDNQYGKARITHIDPVNILSLLEQGSTVIVTGFQGKSASGDVTTLGRGGSDTSATALAAALRAERVDIYTDVVGILTADPRQVEDARPLAQVSYVEICNMARQGAKVVHPRAVEIAAQANIPLRVRSTFSDNPGTLVASDSAGAGAFVKDRHVTSIAHVGGITQIAVTAGDLPGDVQLSVFRSMAKHGISVDFINVTPGGCLYTVFDHDAERAVDVLEELGYTPSAVRGCAKVSVIGGGMNGVPGIMASIVEALSEEGISILQSADSNTTIWVLVRMDDMTRAIRVLHAKFGLHLL
jgi:aspartate kinase